MPAPAITPDDIKWLRDNPDKADKFEAAFGVPAQSVLNDNPQQPTEADILHLQEDSTRRANFEKAFGFGSAKKYLPQPKPTELEAYQSMEEADAKKNGPPSLFTKLSRAPQRFGAASRDLLGSIFDPRNIGNAAAAAGDVVGRVPEIVSAPEGRGEMLRGAYQGLGTIPGQLSDLALSGIDRGAQIIRGDKPLVKYNPDAYNENPLGTATNEAMLEDWGNKATDSVGLGDRAFDFSDPGTEPLRTARTIGSYVAQGAALGGPKAVIPAVTGAIGSETAREVAPDQPNWQPIGGAIGAVLPDAVTSTYRGIGRGIGAVAEAPAARQFTAGGRSVVAGDAIRAAGGPGYDPNAPLPRNPLEAENAAILANANPQGPPPELFQPTLGQQTGNRGILAFEKSQAMSTPDIAGQFADRQATNQSVTRGVVADLRGTGMPEDLRTVAEQALQVADQSTASAEGAASSGRTLGQAGTAARERLQSTEDNWNRTERKLWQDIDPTGESTQVDVDQIRQAMRAELSKEPKFFDRAIPQEVEEGLMRLNPMEQLSEIQPIRSSLLKDARSMRETDPNKARIYDNLARGIKNVIDAQKFDDPAAKARWDQARQFTRTKNELFDNPNEMRSALASNARGGDATNASATLDKFIQPGAKGLSTIRQLLDVDNSPEMHGIIQDHLAAQMPDTLKGGQDFIDKRADILNEVPVVRDSLQRIVDARAAAATLKQSPLGRFIGPEPDKAVDTLFQHSDRIRAVRQLRTQLSRIDPTGRAWNGLKAATVDKILRTVESSIERDGNQNPTIMPGVMNKFYRNNADLLQEILGTQASSTVGHVADAMEMMSRTARSGKEMGSPTAPALAGDRFLDHMLQKYMQHTAGPFGSGAALATAGGAVGGMPGAAAGFGIGIAGHLAFASAKAEIANLLARALLNPEEGKAMMQPATPASVRALPRAIRPYFKRMIQSAAPAATGAQKPATEKKPLKPGQTVSGIIDGAKVVWKYLGGDPKAQASWAKQ